MSVKDPLPVIPPRGASALPADGGSGTHDGGAGNAGNTDDPPPVRPPEPDPEDCCGEGCVRCVYDRYDLALERYQLALAAWQARHP